MKIDWRHLVTMMAMALLCAMALGDGRFAGTKGMALANAVELRYDRAAVNPALLPESSIVLTSESRRGSLVSWSVQEPVPEDTFALVDYSWSTSGGNYQINRVERRVYDFGNGFFAGVSTGAGWRMEDGVPVAVPFAFAWGGEMDLDAVVLIFRAGADLIAPQGEKFIGRFTYGVAFRVPAPRT